MRKYIDLSILRDFSEEVTFKSIDEDLTRLGIRNILEKSDRVAEWDADEARCWIVEAFRTDYEKKRANYKAYLEEGMDIRFAMELRKSALLLIADPEKQTFYTGHSVCSTIQEIKEYRIKYLIALNDSYQDLDWQLYMLIRHCWGRGNDDILIDYESCYNDGNPDIMCGPGEYRIEFLKQHIDEDRLQWII